ERLEPARERGEFSLVERGHDSAAGVDALGHLEAQLARDQRLVALIIEVKRIGPVRARDLQHIAEALGGYQSGPGAAALDQRIDDQRRAVIEEARVGRRNAALFEAIQNAFDEVPVG